MANNPYEVLGITPNATDDEVKEAYRELAKKYHPDKYANTPDLAAVASDKMKEVNEAYDTIVADRKKYGGKGSYAQSGSTGASGGQSYSGASSSSSSASSAGRSGGGSDYRQYSNPNYGNTYSRVTDFGDVRRLLMNEQFGDAEQLLEGVPAERRNAEWNFLKGVVSYRRGWLEQAYAHLDAAVKMDPNNAEFRAAYEQSKRMRTGKYGGYRAGGGGGGCGNPCSMCFGLVCADTCCECFGGDIISCI